MANDIYDGRNRCDRCNKPLSDPTANYGSWCAKILGVNPATIAACIYTEQTTNVNIVDRLTDVPAYGYVEGSREKAIAYRLTNESENVNYVAAYLRYFQDRWKPHYPEIDGRTAILATLFNQGELRPPHNNPQANSFGDQAKKEYYYMKSLLGLD